MVFVISSFLFPHPVTPAGVSTFLCLIGSSPVLRSVLMWIAGMEGNPELKTLFNFYQTPYCLLLIPLVAFAMHCLLHSCLMHNLRPVLEFYFAVSGDKRTLNLLECKGHDSMILIGIYYSPLYFLHQNNAWHLLDTWKSVECLNCTVIPIWLFFLQ